MYPFLRSVLRLRLLPRGLKIKEATSVALGAEERIHNDSGNAKSVIKLTDISRGRRYLI